MTQRTLPHWLLNIEGLAVFLMSGYVFAQLGFSWWWFIGLLLVPDVAAIGYLMNTSMGSRMYNIVHTYSLPLVLAIFAYISNWQFGLMLAVIWCAHIGMDRVAGYGLKYASAFKDTHLQRV